MLHISRYQKALGITCVLKHIKKDDFFKYCKRICQNCEKAVC